MLVYLYLCICVCACQRDCVCMCVSVSHSIIILFILNSILHFYFKFYTYRKNCIQTWKWKRKKNMHIKKYTYDNVESSFQLEYQKEVRYVRNENWCRASDRTSFELHLSLICIILVILSHIWYRHDVNSF